MVVKEHNFYTSHFFDILLVLLLDPFTPKTPIKTYVNLIIIIIHFICNVLYFRLRNSELNKNKNM